MSRNREEALKAIAGLVGCEPVSAFELHAKWRHRCRWETFSRYLATLFHRGVIDRRWDGNQRFGRYVYFSKAE